MVAKAVSIVIPNWNGTSLLRAHLPSVLVAAEGYPGSCEVIVVDDASTDDSRTVVQQEFPRVRLITRERNGGFGKACNSGAQAATGDVLLFLNSDVEPSPGSIAPLAARFDCAETFAASPLVYKPDGNLDYVSICVPRMRRGRLRAEHPIELLEQSRPGLPSPWYTIMPLGGACMVDRARFLEVGGFDDLFDPFYYEDLDLGLRAWRRGWTCEVVTESRVTHLSGGTIARSFSAFRLHAIRKRNRLLCEWKNPAPRRDLVRYQLYHLVRVARCTLMLKGEDLVGTLLALPRLPRAWRRRRAERAAAVRPDEEVFAEIRAAVEANRRALDGLNRRGE